MVDFRPYWPGEGGHLRLEQVVGPNLMRKHAAARHEQAEGEVRSLSTRFVLGGGCHGWGFWRRMGGGG